jgi:hypothetical protein
MTTSTQTPASPSRVVLDGVPRIHFYEGGPRCPEDIPWPSALRACLECMGSIAAQTVAVDLRLEE